MAETALRPTPQYRPRWVGHGVDRESGPARRSGSAPTESASPRTSPSPLAYGRSYGPRSTSWPTKTVGFANSNGSWSEPTTKSAAVSDA